MAACLSVTRPINDREAVKQYLFLYNQGVDMLITLQLFRKSGEVCFKTGQLQIHFHSKTRNTVNNNKMYLV